MSSFFSERTAEYSLVPYVKQVLRKEYKYVTPIYYWKTREGNSFSREMYKKKKIKVLAMFARRPKLTTIDSIVSGKINSSIFSFAKEANINGIATIAVFIATNSFEHIGNSDNYISFDMNNLLATYGAHEELLFECNIITKKNKSIKHSQPSYKKY